MIKSLWLLPISFLMANLGIRPRKVQTYLPSSTTPIGSC
jgi:hypothetical protein